MDQFTRRIIGFGIHQGIVDGEALCRMFRQAIRQKSLPKYLSTDNDPLYRFHQWQADLDQTLFWTTADLEAKLRDFQEYFNHYRAHTGLGGQLPIPNGQTTPISFPSYQWQQHCRGLYQTPIAA